MAFSKTIQMFIFDGNPNGRIMCELSNWNGRVYKVSRNEVGEFARRADAEYTGVYFLFGKNEDNDDTVYIGEAEKMLTRIKQHLSDREYWNECVLVISKDNLLNKAHVKYLENRFYCMAHDSGRFFITNTTVPTRSSVSEYDEAMLEEFIADTKLLVNTLGYKAFDSVTDTMVRKNNRSEKFYITAARGAEASGAPVADGFAVFEKSVMASTSVPSLSAHLVKRRADLQAKGIVGADFVFTKDVVFTSPSLAAAVIMGRDANGLKEWKTKSGVTLKQYEDENFGE